MEAIPEVQGPVRPPKDLTVTPPPQAMCDPSGPRDKSGSCHRGRGKEKAASCTVSVPHSSLAATGAVSRTLDNGQRGSFYPWIFSHLSKERKKKHRIKEEVGEECHISKQPGAESLDQDEAKRWRKAASRLCQAQRDK